MNNFDVSGLLTTYAEKCATARSTEALQKFVRELKNELNSKEIIKLKVIK